MDTIFWFELVTVLLAIGIGAKWGGLGLGVAGGLGLFVLVFVFGMVPASPPVSVLLIMLAVVSCASILQGSGGLDFLVGIAERILRRFPRYITFLGPMVCLLFTTLCGTAYVAFSVYPVIAEVAAAVKVRPERALSMSVIAGQSGICGSPMSAATAVMIGTLAVAGITPFQIFAVCIPGLVAGGLIGCAFCYKRGKELEDDPEFQRRVASGEYVELASENKVQVSSKSTKLAVLLFIAGIAGVVIYGAAPSLLPAYEIKGKLTTLSIPNMVQIIMLAVGCLIMIAAKVKPEKLASGSVFRSGLIGMAAVYGVAWLTSTFFNMYKPLFVAEFGELIRGMPFLFAIALFLLSSVVFSQGATVAALMPLALGLGVAPQDLVWMFPAANGYFIIPAGGAIIACVAFDRTGTTRIGKYVLNHSFLIPGFVTMAAQLACCWLMSKIVF